MNENDSVVSPSVLPEIAGPHELVVVLAGSTRLKPNTEPVMSVTNIMNDVPPPPIDPTPLMPVESAGVHPAGKLKKYTPAPPVVPATVWL